MDKSKQQRLKYAQQQIKKLYQDLFFLEKSEYQNKYDQNEIDKKKEQDLLFIQNLSKEQLNLKEMIVELTNLQQQKRQDIIKSEQVLQNLLKKIEQYENAILKLHQQKKDLIKKADELKSNIQTLIQNFKNDQ